MSDRLCKVTHVPPVTIMYTYVHVLLCVCDPSGRRRQRLIFELHVPSHMHIQFLETFHFTFDLSLLLTNLQGTNMATLLHSPARSCFQSLRLIARTSPAAIRRLATLPDNEHIVRFMFAGVYSPIDSANDASSMSMNSPTHPHNSTSFHI